VLCPVTCSGVSVTVGGVTRSFTGITGAGSSTLHFFLSQSLAPGDVVTLSYAPGNITDSTGNPIAAFTK
jgi:hypothetical protein